jgi:hypothetical protein
MKTIKPAERLNSVSEYYFSKKLKEVAEMNAKGMNVISLGIGSPDLPPSSETIEALSQSALAANAHGYMPYVGLPELRKAFADWYQKWFKVELNPANEIQPLIGSKEGILHISMAFLNPGEPEVRRAVRLHQPGPLRVLRERDPDGRGVQPSVYGAYPSVPVRPLVCGPGGPRDRGEDARGAARNPRSARAGVAAEAGPRWLFGGRTGRGSRFRGQIRPGSAVGFGALHGHLGPCGGC